LARNLCPKDALSIHGSQNSGSRVHESQSVLAHQIHPL